MSDLKTWPSHEPIVLHTGDLCLLRPAHRSKLRTALSGPEEILALMAQESPQA